MTKLAAAAKSREVEEREECEHVWMYSTFCDRCSADFETWLKQIPEKVTVNLIRVDLSAVLKKMVQEKKITKKNATDLYVRMGKSAVARDYLKWTSESWI